MDILEWLSPVITSTDVYWLTWLTFVLIIWFIFAVRVEQVVDNMTSMEGKREEDNII